MRALIIEELTFFNNALHMSIKSRIKKEKNKKIKDRPIDYLGRIQGISVCINVYPLIFHTPPKQIKKVISIGLMREISIILIYH